MIKTTYFCIFVLSVMLLLASGTEAGDKHKTTGRVIAKDPYIGLPRLSSVTNVEILVVKADESSRATKSPKLLKIRYEDYADRHPLPSDLLEGKSSWKFSLRRDRSCDQVISEGLFKANSGSTELPTPGSFVLIGTSNQKDIPPVQSIMPCYLLKPGDVQALSSGKRPGGF